jgi:hypothetical protein
MRRNLPVLIALLSAVSFGVAEGIWSGRWRADAVNAAAARLADVPLTFGEWEGTTRSLDQRQVTLAKLAGYVSCSFTHRSSGDTMSILLMCGRPGPISVHTPDICFPGGGVEMSGEPHRLTYKIDQIKEPAEFLSARFDKGSNGVQHSAVLWSWTADGAWTAPDNPRRSFGGAQSLYKLYIIHTMTTPEQMPGEDRDLEEFVHEFLAKLQTALFPPN